MPDEYISRRDARIAILEKQAGGGLDQKNAGGETECMFWNISSSTFHVKNLLKTAHFRVIDGSNMPYARRKNR